MNGKIVFFPLLPFSYDVNRRRDAKRLLAVLYFSSTRRIYWDIIFTSLFIIFFLFSIFLLSFMLSTFRLARRLLFPHILNTNFLLPCFFPRPGWRLSWCLGKSGVISLSSILRRGFPSSFHEHMTYAMQGALCLHVFDSISHVSVSRMCINLI